MDAVAKRYPGLTSEQLAFIEEGLRRSGTGYAERGFATLAEWDLELTIEEHPGHYSLRVAPGPSQRVNAEWGLRLFKADGRVEVAYIAQLAPPPEF
jgi:hypothetical protein